MKFGDKSFCGKFVLLVGWWSIDADETYSVLFYGKITLTAFKSVKSSYSL